jgi:hypothetical protein
LSRKISQKQDEILCRRALVMELRSKGFKERQISEKLGIPRSTIGVDIRAVKRTAATNLRLFTEQDLPHEADMLVENTDALLRIAWTSLQNDMESGKPPYQGIESILHILDKKDGFLENKLHLSEYATEKKEESEMDIQDRIMKEAYEAERHRSEAVF